MRSDEHHGNGNGSPISPGSTDERGTTTHGKGATSVTGILDERIANLRDAIREIDDALAGRKQLNVRFIEQIEREADEAKHFLSTLNPPWTTGFYPQVEFLRLSLHKSLTSRAKERRAEELKYWENRVNLAKERRTFVDEYKALLAARRRLRGP